MLLKFIFSIAVVGGVVAVFYVSWFWRALIVPMILLLGADIVISFWDRTHLTKLKSKNSDPGSNFAQNEIKGKEKRKD